MSLTTETHNKEDAKVVTGDIFEWGGLGDGMVWCCDLM